jgi:hypothetical protein
MQGNKIKTGQAIFLNSHNKSRRYHIPILNNVIYADIKKGKDIIRVYNMHLQSIKISPDVNEISENIDDE